jgi:putative pyruvate formate lyase activating enzyme
MKITRRHFDKAAIGVSGDLVVPDRILQAAGDKSHRWSPAYQILERKGRLKPRVAAARAIFKACRLCPSKCRANREAGEKGFF